MVDSFHKRNKGLESLQVYDSKIVEDKEYQSISEYHSAVQEGIYKRMEESCRNLKNES